MPYLIQRLEIPLVINRHLWYNGKSEVDHGFEPWSGQTKDVVSLSQHSIFYIGTGKKKILAMWDCERILAFLIKWD